MVLREQVKRFTEIAASEMAGLQIKPSQLPYFDAEGRLHGSIKWCIVAENLPGYVYLMYESYRCPFLFESTNPANDLTCPPLIHL